MKIFSSLNSFVVCTTLLGFVITNHWFALWNVKTRVAVLETTVHSNNSYTFCVIYAKSILRLEFSPKGMRPKQRTWIVYAATTLLLLALKWCVIFSSFRSCWLVTWDFTTTVPTFARWRTTARSFSNAGRKDTTLSTDHPEQLASTEGRNKHNPSIDHTKQWSFQLLHPPSSSIRIGLASHGEVWVCYARCNYILNVLSAIYL